jgi:hypothetical protein
MAKKSERPRSGSKPANTEFIAWFTRQYLTWQLQIGERRSMRDFAKYLGFDHPLIFRFVNGQRIPNEKHALKFARYLGLEAFDVLGLPRPDTTQFQVMTYWEDFDATERAEIKRIVDQAMRRLGIATS